MQKVSKPILLSLPLLLATVAMALTPTATAQLEEGNNCPNAESDPWPFGVCGDDGETREFCYEEVDGEKVRIGFEPLVEFGTIAVLGEPLERLIGNPGESDLPMGSVWQQVDGSSNVNTKAGTCVDMIWFDACNFWMIMDGSFAWLNEEVFGVDTRYPVVGDLRIL